MSFARFGVTPAARLRAYAQCAYGPVALAYVLARETFARTSLPAVRIRLAALRINVPCLNTVAMTAR